MFVIIRSALNLKKYSRRSSRLFCKAHGMSKVGATEQAIRQYMDKMNKALKNMT